MKKILVTALMGAMTLSLAACGRAGGTDVEDAAISLDDGIVWEEDESDAPEDFIIESDDEFWADASGELWVNFDNMGFFLDDEWIELGTATYGDLIEDGMMFTDASLEAADDVLSVDYESDFVFNAGDDWNAYIYVLNDTEEDAACRDCHVVEIYLPVEADQDVILFAFPLGMTEDELIANAGEPDSLDSYENENGETNSTYVYEMESTVYVGSSSYTFEFNDGVLAYVTLCYRP